jgi:hypothetical protein
VKITPTHLAFYRERKAGSPGWAQNLKRPDNASVHWLINSQVPGLAHEHRDITNMVNTLKLARKNDAHLPGEFLRCLARYALPQYSTTTKRQAATARRWLRRLDESKGLLP